MGNGETERNGEGGAVIMTAFWLSTFGGVFLERYLSNRLLSVSVYLFRLQFAIDFICKAALCVHAL